MQKIKWPIAIVTAYMVFYNATPMFGFSEDTIIAMYLAAPLILIWMVITILKDGIPSERTFEEYFYDDYDYRRNNCDTHLSDTPEITGL